MANYNQAPTLLADGNKKLNVKGHKLPGYSQRTHCLESAIWCCLGDRDIVPIKVMLFLTGMATDGSFKVSTETILQYCNISERGYKRAREKLVDMGWISHDPSKSITIHYNKILEDYEKYLLACHDDTSISELPCHDDTPSFTMEGHDDTSMGCHDVQLECHNDTPVQCHDDTYNNINNNTNNNKIKIKQKIASRKEKKPQLLTPENFCFDDMSDY